MHLNEGRSLRYFEAFLSSTSPAHIRNYNVCAVLNQYKSLVWNAESMQLNACAYGYRLKACNIYLHCKLNIKSYSVTLIPEAISNTNEWGGNGQTGIKHICDWNSNGWAPSLESKTKSFKTDYRKMSKTLCEIMAGKKMLGPEMSTQKNHGKPPSFKQKGKPFKTAETKTKQQTQSIFLYIIRTWHLQTLIFKDFLTTSTRFEGDYISLESVGFGPLPLLLSSPNTAQFKLFTFI